MDAKEILGKVKQLFADLTAPVTPATAPASAADTPVALNEYDLKDGGKVTIDKLEVGGIVMIDGNPSLPGDIELADGTKITIADNGAITAITPGEAPAVEAPVVEDMGAKFTELQTSTTQKFTEYEQKFSAYEQRFAAYDKKLQETFTMVEQLLQFGKLMVEAPAAQPDASVKPTTNFRTEEKYNLKNLFNKK